VGFYQLFLIIFSNFATISTPRHSKTGGGGDKTIIERRFAYPPPPPPLGAEGQNLRRER